MKPLPPVSVVIPVYNDRHGYLLQCLQSLISQTHLNWEAIVVDDGSTSGDVAAAVASAGDSRIRCLKHEVNRGLSAARNTGIQQSQFELIAMVDSDDLLHPEFLAVLSNLLEEAECDAAFGDFVLFGNRTGGLSFVESAGQGESRTWRLGDNLEAHFLCPQTCAQGRLWNVPTMHLEPHLLLEFLVPPGPGVMLRRSALTRIGGYCEADVLRIGNEDLDFWLTAAEANVSVTHTSRPLYHYRQSGDSLVNGIARHQHLINRFICERHSSLFRKIGLSEDYIAAGYRRSAKAAWLRGERLPALRMVLSALKWSPMNVCRGVGRRLRLGSTVYGTVFWSASEVAELLLLA